MTKDQFHESVDDACGKIEGFIKSMNFDHEIMPAVLCQLYCEASAKQNVPPDFFLKVTMQLFANISGGSFVVVTPDEMEAMNQKDGATLQ